MVGKKNEANCSEGIVVKKNEAKYSKGIVKKGS
mgnify:CR=1 FL=1